MPDELRRSFAEHCSDAVIDGFARAYVALLGTPCVSGEELLVVGVEPQSYIGLIHLTDSEGLERYPTFQFDDEWHPRPVVLEINCFFGTDNAGARLAAWQWWDAPNSWLSSYTKPADQIGVLPDALLVRVARTVTEDL
jgi:DNA/RNA-binding domain of Phe-tRNA-synthetase-like protein